jgi:hypothetical protein
MRVNTLALFELARLLVHFLHVARFINQLRTTALLKFQFVSAYAYWPAGLPWHL